MFRSPVVLRFTVVASVCMATPAFSQDAKEPQTVQSPVAAGPLSSMIEVLEAARRCRVFHLRIDADPAGAEDLDEVRLFYFASMPAPEAQLCLGQWIGASGKRLKLLPRSTGEVFP